MKRSIVNVVLIFANLLLAGILVNQLVTAQAPEHTINVDILPNAGGTLPAPSDDTNRVVFVGDVDCNSDQKSDFESMKTQEVQTIVIAGDYAYTKASCIYGYLKDNGYSNGNTILAAGNHDTCSEVMKFTGEKSCQYSKTINGIDYFVLDGNTDLKKQFDILKGKLQESTAKYKVVVIHQPFVTAASKHPNNGFFKTYDPLFKDNNVVIVDQAHNHNYQRFMNGETLYLVTGTGYHDKGSKMYDITSKDDGQGNTALFTSDDTNGYTVVDFQGNGYKGYYVNSDNDILDKFGAVINNGTQPSNGTKPPVQNGTIDTEENVVCACKNGTVTTPPPKPQFKPSQNITVTPIYNITDISNATTKIMTDAQLVAVIPTKNNTEIQIVGNVTKIGWFD
jgi:predicted phosphodiesterase